MHPVTARADEIPCHSASALAVHAIPAIALAPYSYVAVAGEAPSQVVRARALHADAVGAREVACYIAKTLSIHSEATVASTPDCFGVRTRVGVAHDGLAIGGCCHAVYR